MAAKVRRYRRPQLRLLELARVRARDGRYPRTSQARWKAKQATAAKGDGQHDPEKETE